MLNIDSPYFRFMAEAGGVTSITSTRQTYINAAINDFVAIAKNGLDIDNHDIQEIVLKDNHLENITSAESQYIAEAVRKKLLR